MPSRYGNTVRGRLLQATHDISAAGYKSGVSRQLRPGSVMWQLDSAGRKRGMVRCNAIINGAFPADFTIISSFLELDDGDTGLQVARNMQYSFNRDPFARDFLHVLTDTLAVREEELCLAGLKSADIEFPSSSLVTLRNLATGHIIIE